MTQSPLVMQWLKWLLVAVVASSILHYVDNILFFHAYPEPPWINRSMIDAFWFVMTPLTLVGYLLLKRGKLYSGCLALLACAGCNLLTPGHYFYAPICDIGLKINALILLEAGLAGVLVVFTAGLAISGRSSRCMLP